MELGIDYVTISDVTLKSFDPKQSKVGKPKGLVSLRKKRRELEQTIDNYLEKIEYFESLGCSNFTTKFRGYYLKDIDFLNPKTGDIVYKGDNNDSDFLYGFMQSCFLAWTKSEYLKKNPSQEIPLKKIIGYLDNQIGVNNSLLKDCEKEIKEALEPVPIEDWNLTFVFPKVNIALTGQAAKDLYEELQTAKSGIKIKFKISDLNQYYYDRKLLMLSQEYEIV